MTLIANFINDYEEKKDLRFKINAFLSEEKQTKIELRYLAELLVEAYFYIESQDRKNAKEAPPSEFPKVP